MQSLPKAPFESICSSEEAELIKYGGNLFLYMRVLYANLMYELAQGVGADYEVVRAAVGADPRIGPSHFQVLHDSGHKGAKRGRGAGGVCFIKDVAAFTELYGRVTKDAYGARFLHAAIEKNIDLLVASQKDLDLLEGVHGKAAIRKHKKH
jgi:UDPglucose 6-dehydrogenase